jgi:hypothetical protein
MDAQFAPILAIRLGMCLGLDILFLAFGRPNFVKSFHLSSILLRLYSN